MRHRPHVSSVANSAPDQAPATHAAPHSWRVVVLIQVLAGLSAFTLFYGLSNTGVQLATAPVTGNVIQQLHQASGIAPLWQYALLYASIASLAAAMRRQPTWWISIHGLFPLALAGGLSYPLPVWAYGVLFVLLFLIYGSTLQTRVPLYLSNRLTCTALAHTLPPQARFVDLGSGTGTVLCLLAQARPDCNFVGYELAWIPYLISRWRSRHNANIQIYRRSFWEVALSDYAVLYAFLSPQPMSALWDKLKTENAGQPRVLISNSFQIPALKPSRMQKLTDTRATQLFFYKLPSHTGRPG